MGEALVLLAQVLALVAPVVFLVGFSGCGFSSGTAGPHTPALLTILEAKGTSVSTISVSWTYDGGDDGEASEFEIERTKFGAAASPLLQSPSSPFDDKGLEAETTYSYRVRAVLADGEPSAWSSPDNGTTLAFRKAFEGTLSNDDPQTWQNDCLVQRIEPARLLNSGTPVRISLRASPAGDAHIDRVFISQAALAGDPYDSAAPLTAVVETQLVIPANDAVLLPVDYELDQTKALLVAVDFSPTPQSRIASTPSVLAEGVAYSRGGTAEASVPDRQGGYTRRDRICLVERIDVG